MNHLFRSAALPAFAALGLAACSAGGPDGPAAPPSPPPAPTAPAIQVLPATYDFGKITSNNDPAPLEVTIGNSGNAPLAVTSIAFRAPVDPSFQLRVNGGAAPCGTGTPTIPPGMRCTVEVVFDPASNGAFTSTLHIASNASNTPAAVPISGAAEPVSTLQVRVNQVQRCPGNTVTAYVSVTDQGGYPVTGLSEANFTVTQSGAAAPLAPLSVSYVGAVYRSIATAAALDYSNSLTSQPVAFEDMKSRVSGYFNAMRYEQGDRGEVIKFGSEVQVAQAFTSDKSALLAAIAAPFGNGGSTKLYDAAVRAVDDAALQPSDYRKAVIIATDGTDNASSPGGDDGRNAAITYAKGKGVPLFTVGIGGSINSTALQQMADQTGGLYYEANTSQNLATIYHQLSSILYTNQYVLRFDPQASAGSGLTIEASRAPAQPGIGASTIPVCN
jgi:Ca-activated chloride channel family protein